MPVAVTQVVLAKLARNIAMILQEVSKRRRPVRSAVLRPRHTYRQETGPERMLAEDERSATGRAALLRVGVRKQRALTGDTIDIRRLIAHHTVVVGADVVYADVVTPNHEDIGFVLGGRCRGADQRQG